MKHVVAALGMVLCGTLAAGAQTLDRQAVQACFESTGVGDITPTCIAYAQLKCRSEVKETTDTAVACMNAETAEWDRLLNEQYGIVRGQFQSRDPALATALLEAQRAWIAYRDLECRLKAARYNGGSLRRVVLAGCLLDETAERALEIRDKKVE